MHCSAAFVPAFLPRVKGLAPKTVVLNPRERQIVDAILSAASNKAIAERLGLSEQTVKNRLTRLYKKFGVTSRLELVLLVVHKHLNDDTAPRR